MLSQMRESLQYGSNHDQKKPFLWQEHLGNRCSGKHFHYFIAQNTPAHYLFFKKKPLNLHIKEIKSRIKLD